MATEILASGSSLANSTEVTVASGATATLFLKNAGNAIPENALALVQVKDSSSNWTTMGGECARLTNKNTAVSIGSPGTYRVQRQNTGATFGVEQG